MRLRESKLDLLKRRLMIKKRKDLRMKRRSLPLNRLPHHSHLKVQANHPVSNLRKVEKRVRQDRTESEIVE
jgi:hypothetical protein